MECPTVTDPVMPREYEALGTYLLSDPTDAEPVVARMPYRPHFVRNDNLCEPATFHYNVCLLHLKLFPYLFGSANICNANRVANEISPIFYYFWPSTVEEGWKIKADIHQHLELLKIDDKVVKRIIGDGPTPGVKHRNDVAWLLWSHKSHMVWLIRQWTICTTDSTSGH
uniref:Uncharacterized protein n=1 Tax=Romanomermis culicivorax TaxID=13658 RepID=A0A915KLL4_ROMCU